VQSRSLTLETQLSLHKTAILVRAAFARMKAHVEAIEAPPDPLGGVADLAVVGSRSSVVHGWAVQVYLYDLGDTCGVELVAVGEAGLARAVRGLRRAASLTRSVHQMDELVADLRTRDPRAQFIG
jgi:hypothetical protein